MEFMAYFSEMRKVPLFASDLLQESDDSVATRHDATVNAGSQERMKKDTPKHNTSGFNKNAKKFKRGNWLKMVKDG
jgi:hypothetical protein